MIIIEATIHQLVKAKETQGEGSVTTIPRGSNLPVDEVLQTLCTDLLLLYAKVANSYGTLGDDPTLHTFPTHLQAYSEDNLNLQKFSIETVKLIAHKMENAFFSTGGYALFLRYQQAQEEFMLISMLKLKAGAGIDETTLALKPTLTIDLNLLHEAARINLSRWHNNQEPYLSFIKGREKRGDVSEYFRDALSCLNFTSSSHHTKQIINAADAFTESRADLTCPQSKQRERIAMRQRLYDCFSSNPEEVVLETLAAAIMPSNPNEFIHYLQTGPEAHQYQINSSFTPHKATYTKIRRITGKIGTVSVGFDVADVQAGRVFYDSNSDGIVIKSPSVQLKQAILDNANAT